MNTSKKIDLKTRFKNPIFWFNTILSLVLPVLAYYGLSAKDFTSWSSIFSLVVQAFSNPYVLGLALVSMWNNIINPITRGITD